MTILIVDNSTAFTGALKCALNEAKLLRTHHRFVFLLPHGSTSVDVVQKNDFTTHTLPMKEISKSPAAILRYPFYLLRNTFKLRKIIRREGIDCIQTNDFYNMLGAAQKLLGFRGKLITYVRFLPSAMPAPLRHFWTAVARHYADGIVAVSYAVLKQLPQGANTICVYDPVHLSEKHPQSSSKKSTPIQCLYLANYIKGKGQDTALEAFAEAYKLNQNLRLHFAGGDMGLEKNKAFKKALQARASELGLSEVTQFSEFATDVEGVIKTADIVLNFSEGESFSMTCLEAAYYGTAIIATRCGGPEEIIDHGKTGLLVPIGDVSAMKDAILRLASDAQMRWQLSQNGKEYVRQKFSIESYKMAMQNLFNSL